MAKTLREFLEQRAKDDCAAGSNILELSRYGSAARSNRDALHQHQSMMKTFDPNVVRKLRSITIGRDVLHDVALYLYAIAGEAIKKVEEQMPDAHQRVPLFPWKSFTKIRDVNMHLGKCRLGGDEFGRQIEQINAEIETIAAYGCYDAGAKEFEGLPPHFGFAISMLSWAAAIGSAYETLPQNQELSIDSSVTGQLAKKLQVSEGDLPTFLFALATLNNICRINDQLRVPSRFFRQTYPKLFEDEDVRTIKRSRNKAAHGHDLFLAYDGSRQEQGDGKRDIAIDFTFFDQGELERLETLCRKVPAILGSSFYAYIAHQEEHIAKELLERYELSVLGTGVSDITKRTLLNEEVAWLSSPSINLPSAVEDSYIMAAGRLVQRCSQEDAEKIFAHIHSNHGKLKSPSTLLSGPSRLSHPQQESLRHLVSEMEKTLLLGERRNTARSQV